MTTITTRPHTLRVSRLDADGIPDGPSTTTEIRSFDMVRSGVACVEAPSPVTVGPIELSFNFTLTPAQLTDKRLCRIMGLRLTPKGVRLRRYLARSHGHAPKRRNKHGRVGVRR